jgi:DNA-binding response OmpR family regulator
MTKTILVVEDFTSVRNFICETLQRKGYRAFGVSKGNEAYALLVEHGHTVDLVLTDYYMSDCTGLELLKRIRETSELSQIPVVFLTTESSPEKIKHALEAGLAAWIKKPYRSENFFAEIESAINRNPL